jgi:proteasome lid subunit RPN8/RPN11
MSDVKFGSWSVTESSISVEYSLVLIEEIRQEVLEGFQKLSRGGMEVGGVLYGTHEGQTVGAMAMRPIACEHARGPAFLLSDADREALKRQLQEDAADPRLEGMVCIGWYLSHTRSEIMLSDSDLEIFSEFFPAPWQVTLVVRPARGGTMRAGFFVREPDGAVRSEVSYLEFNFPDRLAGVLDRGPRPERPPIERRPPPYQRGEGNGMPPQFRRELPRGLSSLGLDEPELPLPAPEANRWPWITAGVILLILAITLGLRYYLPRQVPDTIGLDVSEQNGELHIAWNRSAKPVTAAARGELSIVDGKDVRTVPLTAEDLTRGTFAYQRNSGDIEVRLEVESAAGEKTQVASRYLGRPVTRVDQTEMKDLQTQKDALQQQVERLTRENATQNERIQELERTLRILQARGAK